MLTASSPTPWPPCCGPGVIRSWAARSTWARWPGCSQAPPRENRSTLASSTCPGRAAPEIEQAVAGAPQTPFVVLSGSADPSALRQVAGAGVGGLALKRDDFGEFLRVLTEAVARPGPAAAGARAGAGAGAGAAQAGPVILSASARSALRRADGVAAGPSQFLTEREREALSRLVRGESTAGMAGTMGVSVSTARTHIDAVLCKLGAHTRLEAVAYAVREGLVDLTGWQLEQQAVGT